MNLSHALKSLSVLIFVRGLSDLFTSYALPLPPPAPHLDVERPTPTTAQTCSNSLAGYEASGVCCPVDCGTCGGSGCSQLGDGCCTKDVISSGVQCSSSRAAPCIIDGDISGPTPATSGGSSLVSSTITAAFCGPSSVSDEAAALERWPPGTSSF